MSKLERQATAFLRKNGLTWSGQPKKQSDSRQTAFERRIISIPAGGQPRKAYRSRSA